MRSSSSSIINATSDGGVIVTSRQSALWVDRWLNVRTGSDREFRRRWIVLAVTRLEIHFSDHQSQPPTAASRSPSPTPHQLLQHPHRALPSSSSSINNNTLLPSSTSSPPLAVLPLSRVYLANATSRNCFNLVCDAKFFTFKCADAVEFEEVVAALTDLSIEVPQSIRNPSASLAPPPSSSSAAAGGDGGRSVSSRGGRRAGRNADGGGGAAAKSRSSPVMMFRGFSPQSAGAGGAAGADASGELLIVDQRQRNPSPVAAAAAAAALAEALRSKEADADAAQQLLAERDAQIQRLQKAALAQTETIAGLESQLLRRGDDERDALAAARNVAAAERDAGLAALRHQLDAARCEAVDCLQREHDASVSALRRSHSDELQRAASAHSASMQRLRAQLAAVSAAHCRLLLQHPSSKRFVDAGVQCEILVVPVSGSSSSSNEDDDDDGDDDDVVDRKRKRRRGVESAQVAGLRDAMRRLRADIEGTPLFESPNILPSSGTVAPLPAAVAGDHFDAFNSPPRVVPSHLNDVPAAFASARRADAAAASTRPRRTAAAENSARRNSNNNSATVAKSAAAAAAAPDISTVLSKRNPYAAALAAQSGTAASKMANTSGTAFGIDAARSSARRDSVLSAAGGAGGGVSFNSSQSLPDSVLTGAGDQPHFGGANSLFSDTASSAAMQQQLPQRSADHGAIDQLLGAASRIYREYLSLRTKQHEQEAAAAQQAAASAGPQQPQQHDASSFCLLSSRPSTARPAGVHHMNCNTTSSSALNVSAASLTASAANALSAELAALLCALLDMLKRRNREWLRHHLCAESIARFALALKRAGKILKSVKGAAGFAEDFAASWKITEHLIELPRLLIEEDQAFVLLHQLLSTAPSLASGASSFLAAP